MVASCLYAVVVVVLIHEKADITKAHKTFMVPAVRALALHKKWQPKYRVIRYPDES